VCGEAASCPVIEFDSVTLLGPVVEALYSSTNWTSLIDIEIPNNFDDSMESKTCLPRNLPAAWLIGIVLHASHATINARYLREFTRTSLIYTPNYSCTTSHVRFCSQAQISAHFEGGA